MAISAPGRKSFIEPIGYLRSNPITGGKKQTGMALQLTSLVDVFSTLVLFLLNSFSSSGELMFMQKDITLPDSTQCQQLNEQGPVVSLLKDEILVQGEPVVKMADLDEAEPGIPDLTERLTKIRERDEKLVGRDPGQPYDGHVLIQADIKADFLMVRKTIFSVNEAGWTHLQFAVSESQVGTGAEEGDGEG